MNDIDILQKALQKAVDNGWKFDPDTWSDNELLKRKSYKVTSLDFIRGVVYFGKGMQYNYAVPILFIFRHDFARAFWKEIRLGRYDKNIVIDKSELPKETTIEEFAKTIDYTKVPYGGIFSWQYHLQQMILEEEPLKYLKKFI